MEIIIRILFFKTHFISIPVIYFDIFLIIQAYLELGIVIINLFSREKFTKISRCYICIKLIKLLGDYALNYCNHIPFMNLKSTYKLFLMSTQTPILNYIGIFTNLNWEQRGKKLRIKFLVVVTNTLLETDQVVNRPNFSKPFQTSTYDNKFYWHSAVSLETDDTSSSFIYILFFDFSIRKSQYKFLKE